MRIFLLLCAVALPLLVPVGSAAAAIGVRPSVAVSQNNSSFNYVASSNCVAKASALVASYSGAQILSVTDDGGSCVVVIRINGKNGGPPRIVTKVIAG